ncbi:MARH2-like protein [Mya arenaria]|uniref:MARH2-like protein n=1 Tax=Mya arenaria TaxID=6604 RepID=A0ABY7G9T1_MYAAR|nr:MARH2-like protein [Mya arenaria]
MSRSSLRRQLFHRNIDALLHSSVLDVVEEEVDSSRGRSQVHYTAGNHESPLKFQFPNPKPGSSGQLRDNDLQFSPIPHSKATGTSRLACGSSVRALPMSPALFLTQTTSTPGPSGVAMDSPTCHSIIEENNNTIFNFPECNMCRICHEDGSKERLWSPCHCKGTMGMLHLSCLETWLGSSNTTRCEICHFEFIVEKKPRPFKWTDRWVIIRDACMTVCLAILVLVVTVLCLVFAEKLRSEDRLGPAMVLVMIATCAIILFAIWIMVARNLSARQSIDNPNLCSSFTFINCSVGSYKTAMMSPVTPKEPLLCAGWDENDDEVTSLDESSPSVVSPDSFYDDGVSYYQPPELGTTALLSYDAGVVKETGTLYFIY